MKSTSRKRLSVKQSTRRENIEKTMIARLHNNGVEVRVDLGNTGENWPNCQQSQIGFPWLTFGVAAWQHAEDFARENGATEIIKTGLRTE